MQTLHEIGLKNGTDKATFHEFTKYYDRHFDPIRFDQLKILEIGVLNGASIAMWNEFFVSSTIEGADIIDVKLPFDSKLHHLDCENDWMLSSFASEHKSDYDIIIDDGGHTMLQQQLAINYLFDCVKPGGFYVIEDLHTSFMPYLRRCNRENIQVTYDLVKKFMGASVEFSSPCISDQKINEIREQIELCEVWSRVEGDYSNSTTCLIKKVLKG